MGEVPLWALFHMSKEPLWALFRMGEVPLWALFLMGEVLLWALFLMGEVPLYLSPAAVTTSKEASITSENRLNPSSVLAACREWSSNTSEKCSYDGVQYVAQCVTCMVHHTSGSPYNWSSISYGNIDNG